MPQPSRNIHRVCAISFYDSSRRKTAAIPKENFNDGSADWDGNGTGKPVEIPSPCEQRAWWKTSLQHFLFFTPP
jgi:hypothetical protein